MDIPTFRQGQLYKRSSIHDQFGGGRQSGIAPSRRVPAIFVFTGESGEQHGYLDAWDALNQVFSYTGEGQLGDMKMDAGNAAIQRHVEDGRSLHLFKTASNAEVKRELPDAQGTGYCRYVGEMQCASVSEGSGRDRAGNQRRIFQFQLVRVETLGDDRSELEAVTASPQNLFGDADLKKLRDQALQAAAPSKKKAEDARRTLFERARHVVAYALARAGDTCEACGYPAPFLRANGSPYLEVHHIDRLSDGGLDAPHRVAAICPTCHRRIHCGADGPLINDKLRAKIEQLEQLAGSQVP